MKIDDYIVMLYDSNPRWGKILAVLVGTYIGIRYLISDLITLFDKLF